MDFRGWNFAGAGGLGAAGRMDIIPGSRMGNRLGDSVAVSSRPIVVTARPGQARDAVQGFVREAPTVVGRAGGEDSARLAPVLARERELPAATVEALRDRAVVAERGRLAGPGVADIAPRGARVDQTRTLEMRGRDAGRTTAFRSERGDAAPESGSPNRGAAGGRNTVGPRTVIRGDQNGVEARPIRRDPAESDWRGTARGRSSDGGREVSRPAPAPPGEWRSRSREIDLPDRESGDRARPSDWRSRSPLPPARRVIEGAVPGRRDPDSGDSFRRSDPRDIGRGSTAPRDFRADPRGPRSDVAPRSSAPPPRSEPRSAPAPRGDFRSAPSQAPRMAPAPPAPRPAPPPPHRGRN